MMNSLTFDKGNRHVPNCPKRVTKRLGSFYAANAWGMSDCGKLVKRRNVYADRKSAEFANWNDTYANKQELLQLGRIEVVG